MELRDGMFAVKLCELEHQYGLLRSRLELCQGADHEKIRHLLADVLDDYRESALLLEQSAEGCRSPAVAELAGAFQKSCPPLSGSAIWFCRRRCCRPIPGAACSSGRARLCRNNASWPNISAPAAWPGRYGACARNIRKKGRCWRTLYRRPSAPLCA